MIYENFKELDKEFVKIEKEFDDFSKPYYFIVNFN